MKPFKQISILMLALSALLVAGCNDTAAGMAEDTAENARATADAAENAAETVEEGAEEVAENAKEAADDVAEAGKNAVASALTAEIKGSFVTNPVLNDDNVKINVDSDAEQVVLRGTVKTQEQKDMAETVAKAAIEKSGDGQKLVNQLTVNGA